MTNQTIINNFNKFELYLEGVKVPYSGISISESEGIAPTASISMSATSSSFRVLPGTIVQFFGPKNNELVLLFEGYISTLSYSKRSSGGRQISFNCYSNLSKWESITVRPHDSIMTKDYAKAIGNTESQYFNLTDENKEQNTPETNSRYSAAIRAAEEKITTELYGKLEGMFKDISLSQQGDLSDEMNALFDNEDISKGDLDLFIKFFLKKFELFDLFYGIDSLSLGISDSVLTFPNVGKMDPFKFKSILENTFEYAGSMRSGITDRPLHLIKAIQRFLSAMHYTQINPAAFTSTLPFWTPKKQYDEEVPVRSYFCPNLENSPPAKCNLFFPHDVTSLSFNHNMESEPTRTIGEVESTFTQEAMAKIKGLKNFVTEPNLNITNKGSEKNKAGFTLEETYRGVKPLHRSYSDRFAELEKKDILEDEDSGNEVTAGKYREKIRPSLNQMTQNDHIQARLSQRNLSLQTPWNPDRLIGVPGAVIGDNDEPSFTGVVSAVTTRINASGQAASTISLRGVRTIYDLRDLNQDNYEFLINDFTADPYTDLNSFLFDPDMYGFRVIGETLYPVFMGGTLTNTENGKIFKRYSEGGDTFSASTDNINEIYTNLGEDKDYSILDILRQGKEGTFNPYIKTDLTLKEDGVLRRGTQNTRDVYEAIYRYKDLYENIKGGEGQYLNTWTKNLTHRKIISKKDYFSYIGVSLSQGIDSPNHYKDTSKILIGTDNAIKVEEKIKINEGVTEKNVNDKDPEELKVRFIHLNAQIKKWNLDIVSLNKLIEEKKNVLLIIKDNKLIKALEERKKDLIKKRNGLLEQLNVVEPELEEKEKERLKTFEIVIEPEFETDLFKPYNLIRKTHVDFAFSRQIKSALENLPDKEGEGITHNIDIVK